jgi:hypothetical protein
MNNLTAPSLSEFLSLGDQLTAAGYKPPAVFEKARLINDAMGSAISEDRYQPDPETFINLTPEAAGELLRNATIQRMNFEMARKVRGSFEDILARSARMALNTGSGDLIRTMRKRWNTAAATVKVAAEAGLNKDVDMAELLATAEPSVITAYRNLGPAVRTLDEIASLRNQMTEIGGVGPRTPQVAAYVTGVDTPQELATAQSILKGTVVTANVQVGRFANIPARVPVQRFGGAWLALVNEGFTLALNDGPEAEAVVAATEADDEQEPAVA